MMASGRHGTLYVGVTSDLLGRISQHREEIYPGFTSRYGVKRLVWFETYDGIVDAIQREKSLKKWKRQWKIELIESSNPDWDDLYPSFFQAEGALSHLQPPTRSY
ncbi:GIY-YIG nuclease family protein [Phenylobacterium sp.]|uniref:GIY-YIG nuclease family protein n=1 Tax=Phenylobacterium sp. TaxID=1871053 RepID=UPI0025E7A5C1|nr:GIY-YIG nuclease family protein [Phenylobacterium sp.]